MNKYQHLVKIDAVLSALNGRHKEETERLKPHLIDGGSYATISEWAGNLKPSEINLKIAADRIMPTMLDYEEILLILKHLIDEGMIYKITTTQIMDENTYGIEYRGRILIENGGLNQKQLDADLASKKEKTAQKLLTFWTASAAFGAIGLLFWEVWKWYFPNHDAYPNSAKNMLLYFF